MEAYIVGGYRSAIGKAPRGGFRFTRPDDIAVAVIRHLMNDFPQIEKSRIDDIVVGNAFPEAESGLNIGRMISIMSMDTVEVPGSTINRYCASGLESIAIATAKIRSGMADMIIAGGVETMSLIAMGGWRSLPNPTVAKTHPDWWHGMGLTAEAVVKEYNITREEQDEFALKSHKKALKAQADGKFDSQIVPIEVTEDYFADGKKKTRKYTVDKDEGPRKSNIEGLARLKGVFAQGGSVTAGNSSQMSDGAAFVLVVSEKKIKEHNLTPVARLVDYQVAGVEPYKMGIGPMAAIPKVLKHSGMNMNDIEQFELNEAFASQSIAVLKELDMNPEIVNVNGGALALGHPLGATGAKLTVQLLNEMKLRKQKYGMVTMCIGSGQGAAGIFELL
ncbi:MAG: acetyl-CoA C-acyltransferase [Bacteroidales bacterium]|nr:acetyl-CoA C-acyltransferase [Bacteroidales bacterium]